MPSALAIVVTWRRRIFIFARLGTTSSVTCREPALYVLGAQRHTLPNTGPAKTAPCGGGLTSRKWAERANTCIPWISTPPTSAAAGDAMRRAPPEVEHTTATTGRCVVEAALLPGAKRDGLRTGDVLRAEGGPMPTALTFAAEFAARYAALSGFGYRAERFAVQLPAAAPCPTSATRVRICIASVEHLHCGKRNLVCVNRNIVGDRSLA
jgi:hypothetical protein